MATTRESSTGADTGAVDLHLLLAGPFVLCDDDDFFRILIPDLMDTHFAPGFTATNNSAELEDGIRTIDVGKPKSKRSTSRVSPEGLAFDEFCCLRSTNSQAYAIVQLPPPDHLFGISGISAVITPGTDGEESPKRPLATKAVLVYEGVDLSEITISPQLTWVPEAHGEPDVTPVGSALRSVGLLVLDMRPRELQTTDDHARMAYRNMAKMVGVDRYMRKAAFSGDPSKPSILHGRYNDCGAALMLVHPPNL